MQFAGNNRTLSEPPNPSLTPPLSARSPCPGARGGGAVSDDAMRALRRGPGTQAGGGACPWQLPSSLLHPQAFVCRIFTANNTQQAS